MKLLTLPLRERLKCLPEHVQAITVRKLYEHWHHLEHLRQLYAALVVTIVVGFYAYLAESKKPFKELIETVPVQAALAVLWVFSFSALAMTYRMNRVISMCMKSIKDLYQAWNLTDIDIITKLNTDLKLRMCPQFRIRFLYLYMHSAVFLAVSVGVWYALKDWHWLLFGILLLVIAMGTLAKIFYCLIWPTVKRSNFWKHVFQVWFKMTQCRLYKKLQECFRKPLADQGES